MQFSANGCALPPKRRPCSPAIPTWSPGGEVRIRDHRRSWWRELHRQYQRGHGPIMECCAKSRLDSRPEKSREVVEHLLGHLLLDVVAARDRFVRNDVGCIAPPHVEEVNCTLRCLPFGTPKQQEWHIELAILVDSVHFEIGGCARPVITA